MKNKLKAKITNEATDENTKAERLAKLAESENLDVKIAVASNPATPTEVLDSMLWDSSGMLADERIIKALALNPNISLKSLGGVAVRQPNLVIRNSRLELDVLLGDINPVLDMYELVDHLDFNYLSLEDVNYIENILVDNRSGRQELLLYNNHVLVAEILAHTKKVELIEKVVNGSFNYTVISGLKKVDIKMMAIANPLTTPEQIDILIKSIPESDFVSKVEFMTKERHWITKEVEEKIFTILAQNPNTPKDVLKLLNKIKSRYQSLEKALALNPKIPAFIRAKSEYLSESQLEELYQEALKTNQEEDIKDKILTSIASNPKTPIKILQELQNYPNPKAQANVYKNLSQKS